MARKRYTRDEVLEILFADKDSDSEKSNDESSGFLEFKLLIIDNLLRRAEVDIEEKHTRKGNHYPELIPANEKKEKPQKRCCLCYKEGIRKETRYQCDTCRKHTALCPAPCFRIYHEN